MSRFSKQVARVLLGRLPKGAKHTPVIDAIIEEAVIVCQDLIWHDKDAASDPKEFLDGLQWYVLPESNKITISFPFAKPVMRSNVHAHLVDAAQRGRRDAEALSGRKITDAMIKHETLRLATLFTDTLFARFRNPKYLSSVVGERIFTHFLKKLAENDVGDSPVGLITFDLGDTAPLVKDAVCSSGGSRDGA